MRKELEFYKYYHNNSTNKLIHFICIPLIVLSIIILIDNLYILYEKKEKENTIVYKFPLSNMIISFYIFSYMTISFDIGIMMFFYFSFLKYFSVILLSKDYGFCAKYMFFFGWIFQFIGHYIEGRRPALFDSISQSFYQAPLFSLEYIFPSVFEKI